MYFTAEPSTVPRLPWYTTFLCVACVVILMVNGASLFHNLQSLKGANTLQGQTARVGDRLQYLNVLVMDAESSLRGYFISGLDVYIGPLHTAEVQVEKELKELEGLLADSPSQQKNLVQLRSLIKHKLSNMNEAMQVYRQAGLSDIVKIAKASEGRATMDEIRFLIVIMVKEQNEVLAARSAAFYQEYQKAVMLGIGINAMAILVLALFYRLVRRSYFVRIEAERALQVANENLESMVARRTEQLSILSRHLIRVSEEEKAKLARELHDELGANLTAISMDLTVVTDKIKHEQPELARMLQRARTTLLDTVELKRRIVENLRPSLLDNLGMAAAIESYCAEFASVSRLDCVTNIEGAVDEATPTHAIAVFRIVQESLNNIVKYAQAEHVVVRLARVDNAIALQIIDDGVGIAIDTIAKPKSHGLLGMRERALLLGGTLTIGRGADDKGTRIEAWIPLPEQGDAAPAADYSPVSSYAPRPSTDDRIPSSLPCSIPLHIAPDLDGQLR